MLHLTALPGNRQRLDGGALFGNAPRALWERWLPADEQNRIEIACRCLLVQDGGRNILLETGIGAFFEPQLKSRFGVFETDHVLLNSLREVGLDHGDIDVVVLSHLHFDHAGGLLSAYSPTEAPSLLFPKAEFVVSRTAFARAKNPHPRDRASFIASLPAELERTGRLTLVGDDERSHPILGPAFELTQTDGHTPGMLHAQVTTEHGAFFFAADLVPGMAWVNPAITMGYDRYAELVVNEKHAILTRLADAGASLFFTHDPAFAAAQVGRDERGRFVGVNPTKDV